MSKRKKLLNAAMLLLVIIVVSGMTIIAATNSGTQSDPLVTLSYLTNIFKPQILSELDGEITKAADELSMEFAAEVERVKLEIESMQSGGATGAEKPADAAVIVTLTKGQSLTCSIGVEIMLRIGTAEGQGSTPALVDSTDATTITAGSALITNHMYLVTIEGNGVKATSDTVKMLVRGNYTIS